MKNGKILLIISMLAVLMISCDESFEPFGEFADKGNLVCLIRCDTTFQAAVLTSSYPFNDDSLDYNYDAFIRGATIRVWYSDGDSVKVFKQAEGDQTAAFGTDFPVVYYVENFQPDEDEELTIEALLPNGERLSSSTLTPPQVGIKSSESDLVIPSPDNPNPVIQMIYLSREVYVQLRLNILYSKQGEEEIKRKSVPISYYNINGEEIPVFLNPSRNFKQTFKMENIDRTMQEISGEDVLKSHYTIYRAEWEMASIDENLRAYYNTTSGSRDSFTIRLQDTNYSNVEGGFGVFGSITNSVRSIRLEPEYIRSFGYTSAYTN